MASAGLIQEVGSGYRVRIELSPDPITRKRRWHSKMCATRKAANTYIATYWSTHPRDAEPTSTEKLADFLLLRWLPFYRTSVREATFVHTESRIRNHVIPHIGHMPLNTIRAYHVEHLYVTLLTKGLKPSSVHVVHASLSHALNKAVLWELLRSNPARGCAPGKGPKHPVILWTEDQRETFFKHIRGTSLHTIVAIIITTGMRRGEALALRWSDVDLDAGTIHIQRTVTRKVVSWGIGDPKSASSRRLIAIPDGLVALLKAQQTLQEERRAVRHDWPPEHWVVDDGKGAMLTSMWLWHHWSDAIAACDLPRIRIHDLRHGAATRMLDAGIPLKVVSDHLGHSSITITANIYQHVTSEMARRAAGALDTTL